MKIKKKKDSKNNPKKELEENKIINEEKEDVVEHIEDSENIYGIVEGD